ncbi:MAG TPA: hypothetical protein VF665_15670 [Longimicrobium sp.]|jgi:hypothetical protein|uniref:hypothetical protein n=1 Tax=Longimicrobium sp. TaxID=2029185 RepID=UPI002EDB2F41
MRMPRFALFALLFSFVAAACGDATGDDDDPRGSLSFTYRGPINGSYSADGELTFLPGAFFAPEGAAGAFRQDSALVIAAARQGAAAGSLDVFTLALGDVERSGTYAFNPAACQEQRPATCRIGAFAPGLDLMELSGNPDLPTVAERAYILVLGSVRVTAISARRVRGEFSGSAVLASDPLHPISIDNGRFDVPIDDGLEAGGRFGPRGIRAGTPLSE